MEANSDKEAAVQTGKKDFSVFELLKVPIFSADQGGKVVYGNEAFAELVGVKKEQLLGTPVLSLIQSETSGMQRALATGDSTPVETWATIKDRKYFFEYRPTPTFDPKGVVRGVVETIVDRTGQKLALQAVQDLVVKAKAGDLSARASVKAEGDYQFLVDGINEMLDALVGPLNVAAEYIDRISKGDIPEQITAEYHGDFNNIKNNLNNCISEVGVLVDEVGVVIRLSREGDLAKRANPDRTKGVYRKILRGINDALDSLINPLHVAADYVDRISKGDLPEQITAEYHGDFNNIKNSLNTCIGAINGVIGEMGNLVSAASEGVLTKRGDTGKFQGAYQEMVQGTNGLIDSIANPLADLRTCLEQMAVNDLTKKMSKDYPGVWDELKGATNSVHGQLVRIRATVTRISDGDLSDLDEYKKIGRRSENDTLMPAFTKLMESRTGRVDRIGGRLPERDHRGVEPPGGERLHPEGGKGIYGGLERTEGECQQHYVEAVEPAGPGGQSRRRGSEQT